MLRMTLAAIAVLKERTEQVVVHEYTAAHDEDVNGQGQLCGAAVNYTLGAMQAIVAGKDSYRTMPPAHIFWPWMARFWKPGTVRKMLVKACAMLLAQIELLDRKEADLKGEGAHVLVHEFDREELGKLVRTAWVVWAEKQPGCKPSWIAEWDNMPEEHREADRIIGEVIVDHVLNTIGARYS